MRQEVIMLQFTKAEFKQLIEEIVSQTIEELNKNGSEKDELLDLEQAAAYLKRKPSTIYSYTRKDSKYKIPRDKPTEGKLTFSKKELDAWKSSRKR